jgi:chromosome segregation ATPase
LSTYDERIAAIEKDTATMKRDIIYKLDETNSAVTIIKGIVVSQEQSLKELKNQVRVVDLRVEGLDTRLEGLKEEIRAIKAQQDVQGQGIKEIRYQQDVQGQRFTALEERFTSLEGKFEQVLHLLTRLTDKVE